MTRLPSLPRLPSLGGPFPRKRRRRLPNLSEEEEESLLRKYTKPLVSGLVHAGHFLGTPGSVVTGTLAGEPGQALEGIFDTSKRIYGREMLERQGLLAKNKPGLDVGDVVGFSVGMGLDPLFWTSGLLTGLSRAGRAARASGVLKQLPKIAGKMGTREARAAFTAEDLIKALPALEQPAARGEFARAAGKRATEMMGQPLGGIANIGPLGAAWKTLGSGEGGRKFLRGLDKSADWLGNTPPLRAAKMLGSFAAGDQFTKEGQALARSIANNPKEADAYAVMFTGPLSREIRKFASTHLEAAAAKELRAAGVQGVEAVAKDQAKEITAKLVRFMEELPPPVNQFGQRGAHTNAQWQRAVQKIVEPKVHGFQLTQNMKDQIIDFAGRFRRGMGPLHLGSWQRGLPAKFLGTPGKFGYFPRMWLSTVRAGFDRAKRIGQRSAPHMEGREAVLAPLPASIVDDIVAEAAKDASPLMNPATGARWLMQHHGQDLNLMNTFATVDEHADKLATYLRGLPKSVRESGKMFSDDIMAATETYIRNAHLLNNNADGIHAFLRASLTDDAVKGVPLPQVFKDLGWHTGRATKWFAHEVMKGGHAPAGASGVSVKMAEKLYVDPKVAATVTSTWKKLQAGTPWGGLIGKFIDSANEMMRQHVTLPWPAYHGRNFFSGQSLNLLSDIVESPFDIPKYGKFLKESFDYWRKPETIPDELLDELVGHGVGAGRAKQSFMGVAQVGAGTGIPGSPVAFREMFESQKVLIAAARTEAGKAPLPARALNFAAGHKTALETGSRTARSIEFLNRVPAYLLLKSKGWSPAAAAAKVNSIQLDYGALTSFERAGMRRWMLFYSFLRRSSQMVAEQLMERPGGGLSQVIQASGQASDRSAMIPEYVARGTSIRVPEGLPGIGPAPGGPKRFLSGLGMMHEDFLTLFGGGVTGFMQEILQRQAPMWKAPQELAFGRSLFRRRPLEDLDPAIQRTYANITGSKELPILPIGFRTAAKYGEFALANLPTARFASTARTLTDDRKSWGAKGVNFFTGFKLTDVSPEIELSLARESAEEALKQIPGAVFFSKRFVPEEAMERLGPDEQEKAIEVNSLVRALQKQLRLPRLPVKPKRKKKMRLPSLSAGN